MKAKELAELLLDTPESDVCVTICFEAPTWDTLYGRYETYSVYGIEHDGDTPGKIIILY